jgi:hypothetical protein
MYLSVLNHYLLGAGDGYDAGDECREDELAFNLSSSDDIIAQPLPVDPSQALLTRKLGYTSCPYVLYYHGVGYVHTVPDISRFA